ncbi:MAG: hypothetical protein E6J02_11260 [Chloroflexi bacterium]|nr:MAG: hypothetical protein E6J02_11260 [Chloroflexota bacterium]
MQEELTRAIDVIHLRFGEQALARVDTLPAVESWPTGVEAIDRLTQVEPGSGAAGAGDPRLRAGDRDRPRSELRPLGAAGVRA